MVATADDNAQRVLVFTPYGKDSQHLNKVLTAAGYRCVICLSPVDVAAAVAVGAAMIVTTEEALAAKETVSLTKALELQPPWSSIPMLVFYTPRDGRDTFQLELAAPIHEFTDTSFLSKPVSSLTLMSAARSALRSRNRQYVTRDLLHRLQEDDRVLAEQTQKLSSMVSESPSGIALMRGEDLVFEIVNAKFEELVSPRRYIGRPWAEVYSEQPDAPLPATMRSVFETGDPYHASELPVRIEVAPGVFDDRYYDFNYVRVNDSLGKPYGVLLQCYNASERVALRLQAEEVANSLRLALVGAHMGTWAVDQPGGTLSGDAKFKEMHGLRADAPAQPISMLFDTNIHSEDRPRVWQALSDAIATGCPYICEYRCLSLDGNYRWIFARGEMVYLPTGEPASLAGVSIDIQDRKSTELKLAAERRQLDQIFAKSPAAMAIWLGKDLVFDRVNADFQRNFSSRELIGKPLFQVCPELQGQGLEEMLQEVMRSGLAYQGREVPSRIATPEVGQTRGRFFDVSYIPIFDASGHAHGVYSHSVDVTASVDARREVEKTRMLAEQANASKSTFLANMSHEIRTPLSAIIGFADQLRAEHLSAEDSANYINVIERNSKHLLRIVDDILDLSKVEAGMLTIEQIEFSLADLIVDVCALMEFKAREKGIQFDLRFVTQIPTTILADPTRIRQILANIVANAIKFTHKGRVQLSLAYTAGTLEIRVADTGIGISAAQAKTLFTPFQQADATMTRKFGGTGLGLALTRQLCQSMGGDFVLEKSVRRRGSTFVARIKVKAAAAAAMMARLPQADVRLSPHANSQEPELKNARILLIEDAPDIQMLIRLLLSKQGAKVEIASDGLEGMNLALTSDFDLVLCDMQMPRMDGYETVQALRDRGYDLPIIALTAHAMKEEYAKAMASGFNGYLTKPVQQRQLISVIAKFTNGLKEGAL